MILKRASARARQDAPSDGRNARPHSPRTKRVDHHREPGDVCSCIQFLLCYGEHSQFSCNQSCDALLYCPNRDAGQKHNMTRRGCMASSCNPICRAAPRIKCTQMHIQLRLYICLRSHHNTQQQDTATTFRLPVSLKGCPSATKW